MHYRNMIPATGSCGSSSSPVELMELESSCPVSAVAAASSVTTSVPGSDAAVAHCSSSFKTVTADTLPRTLASGENISSAEANTPSRDRVIGSGTVYDGRQKLLSPKTRIRRTQLKMLADDLSKFYAPTAGGKRRELLAQKRSAVDTERSARERQLEVIQKQVSLVEKRKKAELEMAAAASLTEVLDGDSSSVKATGGATADSVLRRKCTTARFKARLSRKLRIWKTKHGKIAVQHERKSSTENCETAPDMSFSAESMLCWTVF